MNRLAPVLVTTLIGFVIGCILFSSAPDLKNTQSSPTVVPTRVKGNAPLSTPPQTVDDVQVSESELTQMLGHIESIVAQAAGNAAADSSDNVTSIPYSKIHDAFFVDGDVFSGRSNDTSSSVNPPTAPRMQMNPFAR